MSREDDSMMSTGGNSGSYLDLMGSSRLFWNHMHQLNLSASVPVAWNINLYAGADRTDDYKSSSAD